MSRDPRIDPKPGDQIRQPRNGLVLRVTGVTETTVSWQRRVKRRTVETWIDDNSWTLGGWRNVVAEGSTVLRVATPPDTPPTADEEKSHER